MGTRAVVKPIPEWLHEICNGDASERAKSSSAIALVNVLFVAYAEGRLKFVNPEHSFIIPRDRWRYMGEIRYSESCMGNCGRVLKVGSAAWICQKGPRGIILCPSCFEQQSTLPNFDALGDS